MGPIYREKKLKNVENIDIYIYKKIIKGGVVPYPYSRDMSAC